MEPTTSKKSKREMKRPGGRKLLAIRLSHPTPLLDPTQKKMTTPPRASESHQLVVASATWVVDKCYLLLNPPSHNKAMAPPTSLHQLLAHHTRPIILHQQCQFPRNPSALG